jgi:hypothetical protein
MINKLNKILAKAVTPLYTRAIKVIDLNNIRENKAGRILDSPWVKIPNVKSFNIIVKLSDPLFKLFGIKKQFKPTLMLEAYRNKRINRYLEHQVLRLEKARINPQLYWAMAQILMKRSNVFRVCAIQHVFKNWYRNYPLGFIINTNRKVSRLINNDESAMDHHRVYIPKGEKGFRPLGVPTPEWRVYLHMYSNFLTFFLKNHFKHQHAFLPGYGTLTAWKEIFLRDLHLKPFIKEWDFEKYFDQIHSNRITEELLKLGIPKKVVYFLENINRSNIKLPEEKKLDEGPKEMMMEVQEYISQGREIPFEHKFYDGVRGFITAHPNNINLLREFMLEDGCESLFEYVQLQWALFDSFRPAKTTTDFNGVAQGSPVSPILANVIMQLWIDKHEKAECVAYADDSISFSDQEIEIEPPQDTGIVINQSKSGYVKWNNEWLKPLKFLGLEFDGKEIKANTRKGSKLEITEDIKLLSKLYDKRGNIDPLKAQQWIKDQNLSQEAGGPSGHLVKGDSWEDYFRSRLIGFIQSRLYNGTWNLDNLEQDFEMKFVNGSWMSTKLCKQELDVFVASSYANWSLLNIFRYNQKLRKARINDTLKLSIN